MSVHHEAQGLPAFRRLTLRKDAWWVEPLAIVVGLTIFIIYSTWAAFQGAHYWYEPYLSPFYSPEVFGDSGHSFFGPSPSWWPEWLPFRFSPAFLILWAPLGFRLTCYYYRKAYYRSYFLDPPACAVGEPREGYRGETRLLRFQNFHRYLLYPAVVILGFLWYDAIRAYFFTDGFGIGMGSLVLTANAALLSGYTFGCHSFRHLIGGHVDCFSTCPIRHGLWQKATMFNVRHMLWAWSSLIMVGLADLYVRFLSMGVIHDVRIL